MAEREVETVERKDEIVSGKTFLGIEFGSTRIKAVLTDADHTPIASGSHEWENRLDHGIWTYTMDDIWCGLQDCYWDLKKGRKRTVWCDTDKDPCDWIFRHDARISCI